MNFRNDPALVLDLPFYGLDGASLKSTDKQGHLCTVTGALWTPHGRSFDGVDDYINCGSALIPPDESAFSAVIWAKPTNKNVVKAILAQYEAGQPGRLSIYHEGAWYFNTTASGDCTIGTAVNNVWQQVAVTWDAATLRTCLDAAPGDTDTGLVIMDCNTLIGAAFSAGQASTVLNFPGLIGEVLIYNRALSFSEIQHIYLATKWRYQ